jgi:tricorn protease-like protein
MLWGSTNRTGGPGKWDIWEATAAGKGWSEPRAVSFNSPANDFDPSFAPDGSGIYFFSNRAGGLGGDDIYFAPVARGGYGAPRNLGPRVNSVKDEWGPTLSSDGQRLLFASDGRGGTGKHDLFISRRDGAGWAEAVNLGSTVSSALDDFDAAFLDDGRSIAFASERRGVETAHLYVSMWTDGAYRAPVWLGAKVNHAGKWNFGAAARIGERGVLYYNVDGDVHRFRYRLAQERATGKGGK